MRISDWSSDVCSSDLGGQPGRRLRRDQRAFPESRVELGEIGEAAGDAVDAGMLGAVTAFAAAIDQVFQHDEALARAIVVPVRVIAGRGLRGQLRSEELRVGQEWGSTCRSRGSPSHKKKTTI